MKNNIVPKFTVHRRQLDNTIYAYTCNECGRSWKIYQDQYHSENCSHNKNQKTVKIGKE